MKISSFQKLEEKNACNKILNYDAFEKFKFYKILWFWPQQNPFIKFVKKISHLKIKKKTSSKSKIKKHFRIGKRAFPKT